jgi:hypothetical protein
MFNTDFKMNNITFLLIKSVIPWAIANVSKPGKLSL